MPFSTVAVHFIFPHQKTKQRTAVGAHVETLEPLYAQRLQFFHMRPTAVLCFVF